MTQAIVRTLIVYGALVLTMRLLGKRQIGEMQLSELVITLLLSEIAALPIVDGEFSLWRALVPIAILVTLEVGISFAVTKSPPLKLIFDGKPSVLICRGELRMEELSRLRLTLDELLSELRQKGVFDLREVEYALLEHNGKLSVSLAAGSRPATPDDLSLKVKQTGIAHTLVVDGSLSEFNLRLTGRDRAWVEKQAEKRGAVLRDVLLMTLDDAGEITVVLREKPNGRRGKRHRRRG